MSALNMTDDIEKAIQEGPKPRLCKLYKWQTTHQYPYGFFLRQDAPEVREGIFTHSIRRFPPSAAYLAGLRNNDKVIEVNYTYLEHATFEEVHAHVGEFSDYVTLLVACPVTVRYYAKLGVKISHKLPNLLCFKSPQSEPPAQGKLGPAWRPMPCPKDLLLCDAPLWNELNTTKDMSRYQSKWSLKSVNSTFDNSIEIRLDQDPDDVDEIDAVPILDETNYLSFSPKSDDNQKLDDESESPKCSFEDDKENFPAQEEEEEVQSSPVDKRKYIVKDFIPTEPKPKKIRQKISSCIIA